MLVTATDLQSTDAPLPKDVTAFECTRKIRRIDGGIEIEYQFSGITVNVDKMWEQLLLPRLEILSRTDT